MTPYAAAFSERLLRTLRESLSNQDNIERRMSKNKMRATLFQHRLYSQRIGAPSSPIGSRLKACLRRFSMRSLCVRVESAPVSANHMRGVNFSERVPIATDHDRMRERVPFAWRDALGGKMDIALPARSFDEAARGRTVPALRSSPGACLRGNGRQRTKRYRFAVRNMRHS